MASTRRVVILARRPTAQQFSVEREFGEVAAALSEQNVSYKRAPEVSTGLIRRLRNIAWAARHRDCTVHVAGDIQYCALAIPRQRVLLTILDLAPLHKLRGYRRFLVRLIWYSLPLWWARRVTVISDAVKHELQGEFRWASQKIEVVPCHVSNALTGSPRPALNTPVRILQVGTGENKNLERVIRALADLDVHLRIVGVLTSEQEALLRAHELSFSAVSQLTDDEIRQEYYDADIVVFVSTYEGFGLPVLEAQASCRPVVTSDRSPMREVAGEGAVLVDPLDTLQIRAAVSRLIDDESERRRLVALGRANVERYRLGSVSGEYRRIYDEMSSR